METIGRTNDGKFIVEMTRDEHKALAQLHEAVSGRDWHFMDTSFMEINSDMKDAIVAVKSFALTKNVVNSMKSAIEEIDSAMFPEEL